MRQRYTTIILALALVAGCNSGRPDANSARSVDTQTAGRSSIALPATTDAEERLSFGNWDPTDPDGNLPDRRSRFDIGAEHYASGRLVLTLDTISPRVLTEDVESTRTLTDSLVVTGISSKESWSRACSRGGRYDGFVVGVIPNTVTAPTIPRLAWQFDTVSFRIRAISTDSILCSVESAD
jgi:hypothetical protein